MPLTLPAHAAAVIPFHKLCPRWLSPTALVIGACAPDLGYLFALPGRVSHHVSGIPLDVAIALLFVLWTKWLVLPALTPVAPTAFGIQWREMLRAESVAVRVLPEIAGAALGVLTHLLWDGFTHRGWWPASVFWGDVRLLQMPLTEWLWLISTAFGSLAVWMFLRKRFAAPLARIDFNGPLLRLFVLVLCASVVGWRVGVRVMRGDEALSRWNGTVLAAGCGLVALSMWCTWRRIRGHS